MFESGLQSRPSPGPSPQNLTVRAPHGAGKLFLNCFPFFIIATYFPVRRPDELGSQLRIIKRMREGITVPSHCELEACRLEVKLCTMGLAELYVDAGLFYQAIGELDDPF